MYSAFFSSNVNLELHPLMDAGQSMIHRQNLSIHTSILDLHHSTIRAMPSKSHSTNAGCEDAINLNR